MVQFSGNRGPSSATRPTRVGEVLADPNSSFSNLLQQARTLARVEAILADFAGSELAARFQVAALRQDRMVLLTPSAAWATRLRLQSSEMLEFLQNSGFAHLRYIDIRVAPLVRPDGHTSVRKPPSAAAEHALDQIRRLLGMGGKKA